MSGNPPRIDCQGRFQVRLGPDPIPYQGDDNDSDDVDALTWRRCTRADIPRLVADAQRSEALCQGMAEPSWGREIEAARQRRPFVPLHITDCDDVEVWR